MASIANDPNGLKRILFINQDGIRKVIRLGKVSLGWARTIKGHVEAFVQWRKWPSLGLNDATAGWLSELDDNTRDKLAAVGLIDPPKRATLGPQALQRGGQNVSICDASWARHPQPI